MSTVSHVYCGPYLRCENSSAERNETIRSCTNTMCREHKQQVWDAAKFCKECGTIIDKITFKVAYRKVALDPCQVNEQMIPIQNLDQGMVDIWVGNLHRPNKAAVRKFSWTPKYEDGSCHEITPAMMAEETTEFIDQYRDAISTLRSLYGVENVTIKWGLIHYYH